jgi:hypothetical protein
LFKERNRRADRKGISFRSFLVGEHKTNTMVGPHGLEVVMHVAELADVAWSARERHREHVSLEKEYEQEHIETEEALAKERLENERLRAALQVYENALQKELERQGSAQTLGESLQLSRESSLDLFDQLKKKVESPAFLEKLKDSPRVGDGDLSGVVATEGGLFVNPDDPNWRLLIDEDFFGSDSRVEKDGMDSDGYVVVHQEDFVDGIASLLAKYISALPQAKKMSPKDLQKTILKAFNQTEKKGNLRKIWETAKMLYTATSWGATVFGLYRHPVVLQAASMAMWTTCSLILALLK